MNQGQVRTVHRRVIVVFQFDWKMMTVLASAYLIRLLLK
jgi:hypothetical protein